MRDCRSRLLATLLTWMQDRESGVFLAATSNNITILPPEMLRKGRFDEIFLWICRALRRAPRSCAAHPETRRDAAGFDLANLPGLATDFRGRRLEQVIAAGVVYAVWVKQQLSTEILLAEIQQRRSR